MGTFKTFSDLEFKPHPNSPHFLTQATMEFDNGYGVSVITGQAAYSNDAAPYEVAVLYKGDIAYNTHITDEVLGYQTETDVTCVMEKVQLLKP